MNSNELAPGIKCYSFSQNLSEDLISAIEKNNISWNGSTVGMGTESEIRTSQQINLGEEFPVLAEMIKNKLVECVKHYTEEYQINISQDEGLTLLKYNNNNKYDYHVDTDWTSYRVLSALIYLNPTKYDGGETHFKYFDLNVKPDSPSIVLFPSNYMYLHSARPVIEGTKYVIVTWLNDLPINIRPTALVHINNLFNH